MAKVDDRGRVKLPKDFASPRDRTVILPAGRGIVLIKVPSKPLEESSSWLKTSKDKEELRGLADSKAFGEVEEKIRRRELANRD